MAGASRTSARARHDSSSAIAARSASSKGVGSTSKSAIPDGSVTTVSVESPSISGRATPASTGVTRPIQSDESQGVRKRDRQLGAAIRPERGRHAVEHVAVGEDVRAADLDLASGGLRNARCGGEVVEHVVDRDRLGLRLQPARRDHRGEPLHEVPERLVRLAARAHHHRRTEIREGRSHLAQDQGGLVAAAQVLRARLFTKPAEVDDPADALALRHLRERGGGAALALLEVVARRRGPCRARGSRRCRFPRPLRAASPGASRRPRGARIPPPRDAARGRGRARGT